MSAERSSGEDKGAGLSRIRVREPKHYRPFAQKDIGRPATPAELRRKSLHRSSAGPGQRFFVGLTSVAMG